jgi:hypothetical protein
MQATGGEVLRVASPSTTMLIATTFGGFIFVGSMLFSLLEDSMSQG